MNSPNREAVWWSDGCFATFLDGGLTFSQMDAGIAKRGHLQLIYLFILSKGFGTTNVKFHIKFGF